MNSLPKQAKPLNWELLVEQISAYVEVLGGSPSTSGSGAIVEMCQPLGVGTSPAIYTTQNGSQGHAPTIWPEGSYAEVLIAHTTGMSRAPMQLHAAWRFPAGCTDTGGYGTAQYACQVIRQMAGIDDDSLEWEDGSSAPVAFRAWPNAEHRCSDREEAA